MLPGSLCRHKNAAREIADSEGRYKEIIADIEAYSGKKVEINALIVPKGKLYVLKSVALEKYAHRGITAIVESGETAILLPLRVKLREQP